jgi:predicted HicB family RNase H-like nuclease
MGRGLSDLQKTEGKPMNAVGVELKAVRLELSAETHRALRIEAAKQDTSMAALVRGLVEEHLAKRKATK